jgi:hypothetical protein
LKDQKFVTKTQNMEGDQNMNEKINGVIKMQSNKTLKLDLEFVFEPLV